MKDNKELEQMARESFNEWAIQYWQDGETERAWQAWWAASKRMQGKVEAAYREASTLAVSIHKQHYKEESPVFELCDTTAGVITQLDNMYAGLRQTISELQAESKQQAERIKELKLYGYIYGQSAWGNGGKRFLFLSEAERQKSLDANRDYPHPSYFELFELDAVKIDGKFYSLSKQALQDKE